MDFHVSPLLTLDKTEIILAMPLAEVWLAMAFLGLAVCIYATGIPGALVPVSFSSGALLGETLAIAAVAAGALFGSVILFCGLVRGTRSISQHRYGRHIKRLDHAVSRGGILPIIGLRLIGVPHLAVTGVCALASIGLRRYAISTLVGILPAIAIAATAGAAL